MNTITVSHAVRLEQMRKKLEAPDTLILGIDAAKGRHVGCLCRSSGEMLLPRLHIEGTREGFEHLLHILQRWGAPKQYIVAMEPTSVYARCLDVFLTQHGISVVYVNPLKVKSNRRTLDLSGNKSDDRDAYNVVDLARQKKGYLPFRRSEDQEILLAVVQEYHARVRERVRLIIRLRLLLETSFPELERRGRHGPGEDVIEVMKHYLHPNAIRALPLAHFLKSWEGAKGKIKLGRLQEIHRLAQKSVGDRDHEAASRYRMAEWLDTWEAHQRRLREGVMRMNALVEAHPDSNRLLGIPGLGQVTLATYLALVGHPDNFQTARQTAKYFGLDVVENSSGKCLRGRKKLSRRGSPLMRYALYNGARAAVIHNPALKQFYERLRSKGKPYRVVMGAVMAKWLRILWTIHHNGTAWDPERAKAN
jgi:transposase